MNTIKITLKALKYHQRTVKFYRRCLTFYYWKQDSSSREHFITHVLIKEYVHDDVILLDDGEIRLQRLWKERKKYWIGKQENKIFFDVLLMNILRCWWWWLWDMNFCSKYFYFWRIVVFFRSVWLYYS